jgi:hypothetical protein
MTSFPPSHLGVTIVRPAAPHAHGREICDVFSIDVTVVDLAATNACVYALTDDERVLLLSPHPQLLPFREPIGSIAAGPAHALFLTSSHHVLGMGSNKHGQLDMTAMELVSKRPVVPRCTKVRFRDC